MNALAMVLMLNIAQSSAHEGVVGAGTPSTVRPAELNGAGIEQKLGVQVQGDLIFRDERGSVVKLGDYFIDRPVVLVLAYFKCQMLCAEVLSGLFETLPKCGLAPNQYELVIVSFDPEEKPDIANAQRAFYLERSGRPELADHVHFLTGEQPAIDSLTKTVGFSYGFIKGDNRQFAHPGMITILTPRGTIARYFFGIRFQPRDLRLGLVEAGEGKIGSLSDQIALYCLAYDPNGATYSASVMRIVRLLGIVTVGLIIALVLLLRWRERKNQLAVLPVQEGSA